jgi:hypothetical protein
LENQYKNIVDRFFELESREGFFHLKSKDGLLFWDLVRYDILSHILEKKGILPPGSAALQSPVSAKQRLMGFCKVLPFWLYQKIARIGKNGRKDNLLQLISRNKAEDRFVDLIMNDIVREYSGDSCFILEYYSAFRSEVLKSARRKMFVLDIELGKTIRKPGNEHFANINEILAREFGFDCDYSNHINLHIRNYHIEYRFYRKLLRRIQPKRVFYQSLPKSLIAAARELNIPSFDVQHGHFNAFDPLYSYPQNTELGHLKTVTDNFLASGEYWKQFQPDFVKVVNLGSSYFYMDESGKKKNAGKNVLFVSNAFIHDYMISALDRLCTQHPGIDFCYKMHSNQVGQFDDTVKRFSEKSNISVRIFNNIEENLYEADYVVLIQSTVAYQALQIGCRVVVLKKFFYEASLDLYGLEGVDFVGEIDELDRILQTDLAVPDEKPQFFEKFKPEELHKL